MEYLFETAPVVRTVRGIIRLHLTRYGTDGMSIVETGVVIAVTPHAAKLTAVRTLEAVSEHEAAEAEKVVKLRA